jgi:hypothetical protein
MAIEPGRQRSGRGARGRAAVLALAGVLAWTLQAGPAAAAPAADAGGAPRPLFGQFEWRGDVLDTEWHLPPGGAAPRAWVLVQHGFARRCANLRHAAAHLAAQAGVATLCVNADLAGAAPALARALAAWWVGPDALAPDGRRPPALAVVAGHSAGGAFAAQVGEALHGLAPERLAGALLLDPVGGEAFARALSEVGDAGRRPVRAVMAPPAPCNAHQLARPALERVQREAAAAGRVQPVAVELLTGTHVDAEGEDTEAVAVLACREGRPRPENVAALRAWALRWLQQMLAPADATAPDALAGPDPRALAPWRPLP